MTRNQSILKEGLIYFRHSDINNINLKLSIYFVWETSINFSDDTAAAIITALGLIH